MAYDEIISLSKRSMSTNSNSLWIFTLIADLPTAKKWNYAAVLETNTYWNYNTDWQDTNIKLDNPSTNYLVAWIDWDHIWYFEPWTDLWYIRKINTDWITYANISNNPTYTTYATAWADKASLTYDLSITF